MQGEEAGEGAERGKSAIPVLLKVGAGYRKPLQTFEI
jgi:hypothetical protein